MTGPIAQLVALTCYGNAFLQRNTVPQFFPTNSTCQFCDRVTFVEVVRPLLGRPREVEIANKPDEWFSYLQGRGVRGIRLVHQKKNDPQISDRMAAGFVGGGGTWYMDIMLPKERSAFWLARWEVWDQKALDRRIWRVTYGRVAEAKSKQYAIQNIEATEARLLEALREIHAFSARHHCGGFTNSFAQSIDSLTSEEPHGYHKDLSPPGLLPAKASAILDTSQSAWVFGGMGSWNDMGFDGADRMEYDQVSEQLYQTLTESICVAANAGLYKAESGGPAVPFSPQATDER